MISKKRSFPKIPPLYEQYDPVFDVLGEYLIVFKDAFASVALLCCTFDKKKRAMFHCKAEPGGNLLKIVMVLLVTLHQPSDVKNI